MPRLASIPLTRLSHPARPRTFVSASRLFAESPSTKTGKQNSSPGYEGRPAEDHVVHRTDELDVQSAASQSGMKQHQKGEEGSQGLSRKDEGNNNERAKEEHPEAPGPVLGMNDERGAKGH